MIKHASNKLNSIQATLQQLTKKIQPRMFNLASSYRQYNTNGKLSNRQLNLNCFDSLSNTIIVLKASTSIAQGN